MKHLPACRYLCLCSRKTQTLPWDFCFLFPISMCKRSVLCPLTVPWESSIPVPTLQMALSTFKTIRAHYSKEFYCLFKSSSLTIYFNFSVKRSIYSSSSTVGTAKKRIQKSGRSLETHDFWVCLRRRLRYCLMWSRDINSSTMTPLKSAQVIGI